MNCWRSSAGRKTCFGLESLATHHVPLSLAPDMYAVFQRKDDNCLKVVMRP